MNDNIIMTSLSIVKLLPVHIEAAKSLKCNIILNGLYFCIL